MRIACLQFAPQVGDIDNNLNRADSVLAKANPDDLEDLDLLVLPELAFTGYNFKSLNQISPYLEPQGSGISALWARTTALKYNTTVIVGYPERVDVSAKWPTGPEYYNSTLVINGDGETIANYRKSFLYVIDETWALEGKDGFFDGEMPGLGNVAMGICMDLNPYKFEAPWHAFEFAFHILAVEANVVIITMAWVSREDGRHFSRMPAEPDMETLTYWVQRLEPLIRAEGTDEVIVVFCNRTGMEDDLVYAGTSSVIGVKDGEVNVYGILGRSVKDLLVVDTDNGPFAKLVQRSEDEKETVPRLSRASRKPREHIAAVPTLSRSTADPPLETKSRQRRPSPTPDMSSKPRKVKLRSPKIQIPETSFYREHSTSQGSPIEESPEIATPTFPNPTPLDQRPDLTSPKPLLKPTTKHIDTPYPQDEPEQQQPQIFGGRVSIDQETPSTASPVSGRIPEKYFWLTTQPPPLRSPMETRFPNAYPPASPAAASPVASSLMNIHLKENRGTKSYSSSKRQSPVDDTKKSNQFDRHVSGKDNTPASGSNDSRGQEVFPPRPSSPKSRNASRTGRQGDRRPSDLNHVDLAGIGDRLESMSRRPGSAMDSRGNDAEETRYGRARSRDARIESRVDQPVGTPQLSDDKPDNIPGIDGSFMASPEVLSETIFRPQSDILKNRASNLSRPRVGSGTISPYPLSRDVPRTKSAMGQISGHAHSRASSTSHVHRDPEPHIEPDETRTLVWSELSKIVGEVLYQPKSRDASRGRQQDANRFPTSDTPAASRLVRAQSYGPNAPPKMEQRFASRERRESVDHQTIRTIFAPDAGKGPTSPGNPDDEIVAEIIFHSHSRPAHGQNNGSTPGRPSTSKSPPTGQRGMSRQSTGGDPRLNAQQTTPHTRRQISSPPTSTDERRASHGSFGEIKVYKAPTPSNTMARTGSGDSCPNMDGASIHTLTTPKRSPLTPSSRVFEPKTPKAMKLDFDFGSVITSASDPMSNREFPLLDAIKNDTLAAGVPRAKSTVW